MRAFVALIRVTSFLLLCSLPCLMGCGGGGSSEPEAYTKETGPPEEGMVWTDGVNGLPGSWSYPAGGAYDYESGYDDADDDGGSGSPDDVPDQYSNDSDGGYGEGYGTDAYAPVKTGDDDYANTGNADDYENGNANDYGNADNIDRPADLDERRAAAAARERGGNDYASSDGGYGDAAGGGGGSGVYKETIEPIFRAHCYNCHGGGPRGKKGDIDLHTPAAITEAAVIKQFDPDDSELFIRVSMTQGQENRMPPKGPGLSPQEVAAVKDWITAGARFNAGGGNDGGYGGGNDPYANRGGGGGRNDDGDTYDDRDAAPARPKNLAEAASVTFRRGNDLEAMNQLYAQSLVRNSEAAKKVLESYRYLPAKRRATLAVRWGIGIVYKPLYGFKGAPRPPGVKQDIPNEDDGGDDESDEYAGMNFTNEALDYYAGDIGDEIVHRLEQRIERSFYGEVLRAELEKALAGGDDEFDDDPYDDGGYGGGRGRRGGGDGYGGGGGGSSDKPDDDLVEQIMPGVMMLGQAEQSKIFERAAEQHIDLVVLIDIKTNPDRKRRLADSSFRVRLYDAKLREQLATTGRIKNLDLQKKRAKNPDDETIINEIGKIFAVADSGKKEKDEVVRPYKVTEFPNTTSDKAKSSVLNIVKRLIPDTTASPLAKLSEVRFYESRGLLKDTHAAAAFKKITPEHAASLAKVVDENEIRTTLSDWLIADEPIGDEDEDDEDAPRKRPQRGFR